MNTVAAIRTAAGLTQHQLARRSGVAQPNIAAYESGRRRPSPHMLERLRNAASPLPREALRSRRGDLLALAETYGLSEVRFFGSTARGTDRPGSDVDLLVSVRPGTGLMTISAFALAAEQMLGVRVDIVTEGGLRSGHPIRDEAVPL